jgi:hypothetical protein
MRNLIKIFIILTFNLILLSAQVPQLINYQGFLRDNNGVPLNVQVNLTFRIFDAQAAGTNLWQDTYNDVMVRNGIFNVILGSGEVPFGTGVFNGTGDRFLEIQVGDNTPLGRFKITSVAYAIKADVAQFSESVSSDAAVQSIGVSGSVDPPLKGNVTVTPGSNITLEQTGNRIVINSASGGIGGSGTADHIAKFTANTTIDTSVITETASGRIGIDTDPGLYRLGINTGSGFGLKLHRSGGQSRMLFKIDDEATGLRSWSIDGGGDRMQFMTIADDDQTTIDIPFTVTRTGRVGINDNTPNAYLHVVAGTLTKTAMIVDLQDNVNDFSYGINVNTNQTSTLTGAAYGIKVATEGTSAGNKYGVYAAATGTGECTGIYAQAIGTVDSVNYGVQGRARAQTSSSGIINNYGVYGYAYGSGTTNYVRNYGIYGRAISGDVNYAGYFDGDVTVTGTLSKGSGTFKIDHPINPEQQYLSHSFVESPDMMNVYNGNIVLDENGEAWIQLPDWFEALNKDFRYQLTCIGGYAPVYIAEKISSNRFKIAGGTAGLEISWQVTGVRHDPYAEKHPIKVEEDKKPGEIGKYLHPEAYGKPTTAGIGYIKEMGVRDQGSE